jgi:RNA polymerase sigma-70 factor (ECF subfamily)
MLPPGCGPIPPKNFMVFRARPFRPPGEPSNTGESPLNRLPGSELASKNGMHLPREGGEISGLEGGRKEPLAARSPGGIPNQGPDRNPGDLSPAESADSAFENASKPQPSDEDSVPEDMATLVLDKTVLGTGPVAQPDAETERLAAERHFAAADPASDAAIMLRVAAGDESGFNYLVEKYHRAMVHFLFRMVRTQAVAEELAQEVFLRVYRSRESYRAEAKFTTWLYRIATNLAVNHARDTKHERAAQNVYLDVPDPETGTTPEVADDEPTVEQRLLRDERMAAIRKHVMALPERQRMAVLMHKYQGLDYRQIGEVLKLSESATKSLLFRAYQTLRDKLKEFV